MLEKKQCKRNGCHKFYLKAENDETFCGYHPGKPIFHDLRRDELAAIKLFGIRTNSIKSQLVLLTNTPTSKKKEVISKKSVHSRSRRMEKGFASITQKSCFQRNKKMLAML